MLKKNMLSSLIAAGLFGLTGLQAASAETIRLGTGSSTGSYHNTICPAIANAVAADGFDVECVPGEGTGDNFEKVVSGQLDAGLGQFDVIGLQFEQDESEELEERIGTVGYLVPEALYCAAKTGGRVPEKGAWNILNDDEHFSPGDRLVVSTASEKSGTYGTISFIQKSFPNVAANVQVKAKKKFKFTSELGRLRSGKRDLVCFVTMPDPENEKIQQVNDAEDLFFVELDSEALSAVNIGTVPAYSVSEAPVSGGAKYLLGFGDKVKTPQTGVTIMVDEEVISTEMYNALAKAANNPELLVGDDWKSKMMVYSRKAHSGYADAMRKVQEMRK